MAADDPRTVKVVHEDGTEHLVTPEVARALTSRNQGWTVPGNAGVAYQGGEDLDAVREAYETRIATLEADLDAVIGYVEIPGAAGEVVDWVGDDPVKARLAARVENTRPEPRKTVIEHTDSIINPPLADDTASAEEG